MEGKDKQKKSRDVGFDNVKDPNIKSEIAQLVNSPSDATNFIFWYSKSNPEEWGLTLKSIPNKNEKDGFPSQHTWKITWFYKNDEQYMERPPRSARESHWFLFSSRNKN